MAVVFFSYSHADADLRLQLDKHLAPLRRQGLAEGWYDGQILAGDELDPVISTNLDRADVILLLVSADFINSDYCYSTEMTRAFERHVAGEARVIPVILRPCDWQHPPISTVLVTPKDGKPVTSWTNSDEAFTDVAKQVRKAVEEMNSCTKHSAAPNQPAAVPATTVTAKPTTREAAVPAQQHAWFAPGSAAAGTQGTNKLRITKEFSDFDHDEFVHTSFEHIASYFQTSLRELVLSNEGIKERFQRIDARRFTAIVYNDGKSVAECTIRIDSMGGRTPSLAYSNNANVADGSFNEMLHIEHDGHELYYKPLGMASFGRDGNARLNAEGAAEYLWRLLLANLQR